MTWGRALEVTEHNRSALEEYVEAVEEASKDTENQDVADKPHTKQLKLLT